MNTHFLECYNWRRELENWHHEANTFINMLENSLGIDPAKKDNTFHHLKQKLNEIKEKHIENMKNKIVQHENKLYQSDDLENVFSDKQHQAIAREMSNLADNMQYLKFLVMQYY